MGQKAGLFGRAAIFAVIALGVSAQVLAEVRPEVVERISPIGKVKVAGDAKPEAVLPAAEKEPTPAAAPIAEPAPAAAPAPVAEVVAPAAPAAAGGDGASLYVAKGCTACHGPAGRKTTMSTYPKIAGQGSQYLIAQMNDIKSGARSNGQAIIMKGIIAQVSDPEMQAIADWLSGL